MADAISRDIYETKTNFYQKLNDRGTDVGVRVLFRTGWIPKVR